MLHGVGTLSSIARCDAVGHLKVVLKICAPMLESSTCSMQATGESAKCSFLLRLSSNWGSNHPHLPPHSLFRPL